MVNKVEKKKPKRKKKTRRELSIKQRKAIDNLVANGGNKAKALRDARYSRAVERNPSKVFDSLAVKDFLNEILPDDYLYNKTHELIEARTIRVLMFPAKAKDKDIEKVLEDIEGKVITITENKTEIGGKVVVSSKTVYVNVPSNSAKKNGIDIACKIKGTYAPEKKINANFGLDFSTLSDEELDDRLIAADKLIEREKKYEKDK